MSAVTLCLHSTPARKAFKEMAGQNNHFLITLLVGLHAVETGKAPLPAEFRTSWNPKDVQRSAQRSREFAIKALLTWTTDAIDSYVKAVVKHPVLTLPGLREDAAVAIKEDLGRVGQVRALAKASKQADSAEYALICAAEVWRNRLVHRNARNRLSPIDVRSLRNYEGYFATNYQGLIIEETIDRIKRPQSLAPTFKEVTAIVRAAHEFTRASDEFLIRSADIDSYMRHLLIMYVQDVDPAAPSAAMSRINNVWGKTDQRRRTSLFQIAANRGMSICEDPSHNGVSEAAIAEIVAWSPKHAAAELRPA